MVSLRLNLLGFLFSVCALNISAGFTITKIGPKSIRNSTHTEKLRQDLLLNYDKFARPTQHYNKTRVALGLSIIHIQVNEFKSTLAVICRLHLLWTDEKLKWNYSDYGGLTFLELAEQDIWQPDIYLYNSATSIDQYANAHYHAYSNGEVFWVLQAEFTVLCSFNLKYWPFDTQECYMKFGSWTHRSEQIDLESYNNASSAELDDIVQNAEWAIIKTSVQEVYYPCCNDPYSDITLNITLTRLSPSYKAVIITPAFVIIVMILLNFWLPPQAGEKIILNACSTIVICMFMLHFAQKIPAMGIHAPLIVLFYSSCLYIVSFSMISSVIVISLARTKHSTPLPRVVKQPLTGTLGILLGLNTYIQQSTMSSHRATAEEMRDHQATDFDDINTGDEHHIIKSSFQSLSANKSSIQKDWILLAAAIDRISFAFYCLLFLILAIVYAL